MSPLYTVIMAGGAGTRFWPASRADRPKQLLPLAGSDEPLIAATVRRILPLCPPERVLVVTAERLLPATRAALPALPAENFLAEPSPRNTAPCIGWAAITVRRRDPDATLMVLPSDHHIADEEGFRRVLSRASTAAEHSPIVTIGITPTRAETGFGYIEAGVPLADGVQTVSRFVEKPDQARAEEYVRSGKYLWNSGMFFFRARAMVELLRIHLPELAAGLDRIDAAAKENAEEPEVRRTFPTLPSISIDHGVMEKAPGVAVVPGSFGWSDVGSWQSAWELAPKDDAGNAAPDGSVLVDARGNLICDLRPSGGRRIVALVGVENLAVVQTDDALLIIPRERAQEVRAAIELLKQRGATDKL
jgi:mannose-1-phosphate guanylyltransferase